MRVAHNLVKYDKHYSYLCFYIFLINSIKQYAKVAIRYSETSYDLLVKLGWNYYNLFGNVVTDLFGKIITVSGQEIVNRIFSIFGTDFITAKRHIILQKFYLFKKQEFFSLLIEK